MSQDADAGDQETTAPASRGNDTDQARPHFFQPPASERRGETETGDGHRENPDHLGQRPVAGRGSNDAECLG